MRTTMYLFGCTPAVFQHKLYEEALKAKLEYGTKHYRRLFLKHDKTEDEQIQLHWVAKAVRHTEKLLEELRNSV